MTWVGILLWLLGLIVLLSIATASASYALRRRWATCADVIGRLGVAEARDTVAIVTGASSGIGKRLGDVLEGLGIHVVRGSRSSTPGLDLASRALQVLHATC